jgi:hypothetical protein
MVLCLVLVLLPLACFSPQAARADSVPATLAYRCDGEPLSAQVNNGAVDAIAIPNIAGGTVPGAFVVLQWRGITLQLPRTNNAGAPSFTDGKWWWSLEDPEHPSFRLRGGLGDIQSFRCELQEAGGADGPAASAAAMGVRTPPSGGRSPQQ